MGWSPRPPKVEFKGVDGTPDSLGIEVFGPPSSAGFMLLQPERDMHFLWPRRNVDVDAGGGLGVFFVMTLS